MKTSIYILCGLLFCNAMPLTAEVYNGTCGADGHVLNWELNTEDSVLTITGPGRVMADYDDFISPWFEHASCIRRVVLPDSLVHIGGEAFSCCPNLASVTLPASLQSIGNYAFQGTSITSISLPSGLLSIGDEAFAGCEFSSIHLPAGLKSLGKSAFKSTYLESVIVPEKITVLQDRTFANCKRLKEVQLPSGLVAVKAFAFGDCSSLSKINLPESLEEIGEYAFVRCSSLTEVNIPAQVERIGIQSFSRCVSMQRICCQPVVPPTIYGDIGNNNMTSNIVDLELLRTVELTVPDDAYDGYVAAKGWQAFRSINGHGLEDSVVHGTVELSQDKVCSPIEPPYINVTLEGDNLHVTGYLTFVCLVPRYMYYELSEGTLKLTAYALKHSAGYAINGTETVEVDFMIGPVDSSLATLDVQLSSVWHVNQNYTFSLTGTSIAGQTSPTSTLTYDLQGRPVTQPTHGIYIQNGRKVLVR